jgi:hypothetical protein
MCRLTCPMVRWPDPQACGSPEAAPGMHYHDKEGNPIINHVVFPDLGAMAKHAHSLKLTSGWCDEGSLVLPRSVAPFRSTPRALLLLLVPSPRVSEGGEACSLS